MTSHPEMNHISLEIPASSISHTLSRSINGENKIIIRPLALADAPNIVEAIKERLARVEAIYAVVAFSANY